MWFTENPWPPIFILGIAACALTGAWASQRRGIFLVSALAALAGCFAIYAVERSIVTEGEQIEANVRTLTSAFQKKDRATVLAFFSKQAPDWQDVISRAFDLVEIKDDLDVKDMSVALHGEKSQAVSRFRANATITAKSLGIASYQPSRWELHWQKEGGAWKIVDVIRLNPFKDDPMDIFEQRSN